MLTIVSCWEIYAYAWFFGNLSVNDFIKLALEHSTQFAVAENVRKVNQILMIELGALVEMKLHFRTVYTLNELDINYCCGHGRRSNYD